MVIGCERRYSLSYCYITRNRMQNQKIKSIHKIQTYLLVRNNFDHKGSGEKSQVLRLKGLDAKTSDWG
jgi:hypothetical protein